MCLFENSEPIQMLKPMKLSAVTFTKFFFIATDIIFLLQLILFIFCCYLKNIQ